MVIHVASCKLPVVKVRFTIVLIGKRVLIKLPILLLSSLS